MEVVSWTFLCYIWCLLPGLTLVLSETGYLYFRGSYLYTQRVILNIPGGYESDLYFRLTDQFLKIAILRNWTVFAGPEWSVIYHDSPPRMQIRPTRMSLSVRCKGVLANERCGLTIDRLFPPQRTLDGRNCQNKVFHDEHP